MGKTIVTKNSNSIDVKVGSRKNNAAIPGVTSEYGAISYVNEQDLTPEQQEIAQSNIGISPAKVAEAISGPGLIVKEGQLAINAGPGLEITSYDTIQFETGLIIDCGTSTAVI